MRRFAWLVLLVLLPAGAFAQTTRRYIVVTRQPAGEAIRGLRTDDWQPRAGTALREFRYINAFAADLTDDEVAALKSSRQVRWIEPVLERHLLADSVAPGQQTTPYGVDMVHAKDVWPVTKGQGIDGLTRIHVVVIDTGIRYTEPDLKGAYKGGHNFIDGSDNPYDDNGHGTHVAGTIAAADDGAGVVGVAPQVDLYGLKVLDQCGNGSNEDVMRAVEWVISKKAQIGGNWILNLSLGSDTQSDAEKVEFQKAADNGILTFAAAGNGYDVNPVDGLSYPGGYPSVVSVGAIDATETVATFSQRGADLKVVAPGVGVLSTFVAAEVATTDGHQFAGTTPIVVDAKGKPLPGVCLPPPNVAGPYVFCGYGGSAADFPGSVKGRIALIQRGPLPTSSSIPFTKKLLNAQTAGAIGVILFDHTDEPLLVPALGNYTTASTVPNFLPTVFISLSDGTALKNAVNPVDVTLNYGFETYALLNGTSMATPHAAGVAALVWSVAPSATPGSVANAMETTATDLGAAGFDTVYGNGLVNAINAAKQLNPAAFGSGVTPTPTPVTGRRPGRRGH